MIPTSDVIVSCYALINLNRWGIYFLMKLVNYLGYTVLLWLGFIAESVANELPIIAIEYPPFMQSTKDGYEGLFFSMLDEALAGNAIKLEVSFYSTARAHKLIQNEQWCASFYPPGKVGKDVIVVPLSNEPIRIGLYRKKEASLFKWDELSELKGAEVAFIRTLDRDGIGLEMLNAGLKLFDVNDVKQGIKLLIKGRVDYAFADQVSGEYIFQSLGEDMSKYQFSLSFIKAFPAGIWLNLSCPNAKDLHQILIDHGYHSASLRASQPGR